MQQLNNITIQQLNNMKQIRIHGRGGQGVVTAAELVAIAAFNDGCEAQAFPHFGVERTGAPIQAYARIDKKPIRTREHVDEPNILIIQDPSLLDAVNVLEGCDKDTKIILNTAKAKEAIKLPQENLFTIDATKIALNVLGKNIVNTIILGAFAKAEELVTLDGLIKAVERKFAHKGNSLINKNIKAVKLAYNV